VSALRLHFKRIVGVTPGQSRTSGPVRVNDQSLALAPASDRRAGTEKTDYVNAGP